MSLPKPKGQESDTALEKEAVVEGFSSTRFFDLHIHGCNGALLYMLIDFRLTLYTLHLHCRLYRAPQPCMQHIQSAMTVLVFIGLVSHISDIPVSFDRHPAVPKSIDQGLCVSYGKIQMAAPPALLSNA